MKDVFENNIGCIKKHFITVIMLVVSVLIVSLVIRIIGLILYIFSSDMYMNTFIATISTIIVLIFYYKCCHNKRNICSTDELCDLNCDDSKGPKEEKMESTKAKSKPKNTPKD